MSEREGLLGARNLGGGVAENRNAPVAPGEVQGSRPAITAKASCECEGGFHIFASPGGCVCGRFAGPITNATDKKPWLDAPEPERWPKAGAMEVSAR